MESRKVIKLKNEALFRARIILSTLSGRAIRIDDIRSEEGGDELGLRDYEVAFLKLIESITNGSIIEINDTGTSLYYKPGIIYGGDIHFDCPLSKSIGYFLEMIIPLGLFSKHPFQLTLTGVTNNESDLSVDSLRLVSLLMLRKFGIQEHIGIKINKRGAFPHGGGEVYFYCPVIKSLPPIQFKEPGKVRKIRGVASCTKVSPQTANRLAEASRGALNQYIKDIQVYTDVFKGLEAGNSPGFSLTLVAETEHYVLYTAEGVGHPGVPPEDLVNKVTKQLLSSIACGGCVDSSRQWLYLLLMSLTSEDVSSILLSPLTSFTVQFLKELKTFLGVVFKLEQNSKDGTIMATCVGSGHINYNMRST